MIKLAFALNTETTVTVNTTETLTIKSAMSKYKELAYRYDNFLMLDEIVFTNTHIILMHNNIKMTVPRK